jgi:hypothetical protein
MDGALIYFSHELGEILFGVFRPSPPLLDHGPQQKGGQANHHPEHYGFYCRIHQKLLKETEGDPYTRNPEAPVVELDAMSPNFDREIPYTTILPFPSGKGLPPLP